LNKRRIIYKIAGIVFIVLDILASLVTLRDIKSHFSSDAYDVGYLFGSQVFLYIGLIFLFGASRLKKKIRQRELENSIDQIGKQ